MPIVATDLPPPINHIFVDYENVHGIDPAVIGSKTSTSYYCSAPKRQSSTPRWSKRLLQHAANVEMVRLKSSGRNALDFALAYYLGRAVLADPCGYFHIVSKDAGYDPLIEHLRSKHIHVRRHDSFATLTFSSPAKLVASPLSSGTPKAKTPSKPKVQSSSMDNRVIQLLEHLSKFPATRPRNKDRLVSLLVAQLGNKITEDRSFESRQTPWPSRPPHHWREGRGHLSLGCCVNVRG